VIVAAAVPLAMWAVERLVGRLHRGAATALHLVALGTLTFAFAVQALRPIASGWLLLVIAAGLGVAFAVLRWRVETVGTWLRFAALGPVAFVALFLLSSPTSRLLDPSEAAADTEVGRPAPVVMLVFDELPLASVMRSDGTIDAELFPNLAELAGEAHWFRNATTLSSSTWHAAPALVTGQRPEDGTGPVAADHPESLFTLLGRPYEFNVVESVSRICPADLCEAEGSAGLGAIVWDASEVLRSRLSYSGDTGDAVAVMVEAQGGDDGLADFAQNQPARFEAFTDGITDARPALHYLHVLLPHVPFRYLPSGAVYDGPNPDLGRIEDEWTGEEWLVDLGRQRHLLQLGYVDTLLGEVIATLRERDIYDDALVVVTSDHGVSFRPGEPIRGLQGQQLDADVLADLAWIPLLVKEPGQTEGAVHDENVLTIDVLPTIADVVDVEIPWEVDGRSALGAARTDPAKPFLRTDATGFGVDLGDEVRVDEVADLDDVRANGVDNFLDAVGDPDRWWRTGPRADLVGASVAAVGDSLVALHPELTGTDGDVEPGSGEVPALLRGIVDGVAAGEPLAVAVNGTIAATAPAIGFGDRAIFAVVVSDTHFHDGANDIAVYRIT
jgi:hypothetical protein